MVPAGSLMQACLHVGAWMLAVARLPAGADGRGGAGSPAPNTINTVPAIRAKIWAKFLKGCVFVCGRI